MNASKVTFTASRKCNKERESSVDAGTFSADTYLVLIEQQLYTISWFVDQFLWSTFKVFYVLTKYSQNESKYNSLVWFGLLMQALDLDIQ